MTRFTYRCLASRCAAIMALLLAVSVSVAAKPPPLAEVEAAKINYLLHSIESLERAQFIRNGTPYSSSDAVTHLRYKWQAAGSSVVTARDFIRECASKSSVSGIAYSIRFSDGRVVSSAEFLQQQLLAYEREH
jgi:hypothetical protein